MRRHIILALVIVAGAFFFTSCSREGKVKEAGQQGMEEHGMPADWKFSLPKGDPAQGREIFVHSNATSATRSKARRFPRWLRGESGTGPELS